MKNIYKFFFNSIILLSVFFIGRTHLFAQNNFLNITNTISCKIPFGWSTADKEVLDAMNEMKSNHGLEKSSLKYLLYPTENIGEYGYPFISIGYENIGLDILENISFEELVQEFSRQFKIGISNMEPTMGEYFDEIKINSLYGDKSNKQILLKTQTGIPNEGQIVSYMAIRIVKSGLIRVALSSQYDIQDKVLPAYKIVLKTMSEE